MPEMSSTGRPPFLLYTYPAQPRERRLALAVVLASTAVFLVAAPFARQPLLPVEAFLPIYQSALIINDSITALLLYGQYAIVRSRALLLLASAYLFTPDANALFLGSGRGCPSERCGRNFRP